MRYTFDDAAAPSTRTPSTSRSSATGRSTTTAGSAACFHGRVPWIRSQALPFGDGAETWELYHILDDFSQGIDLAEQYPDKLRELQDLFDTEAGKFGVYPLSDETVLRALPHNRPSLLEGRTHFTLYPDNVRMPELASVNLKNTSFDLTAFLDIPERGPRASSSARAGRWPAGRCTCRRHTHLPVQLLRPGDHRDHLADPDAHRTDRLSVSFDYDGGGLGKGGTARMHLDGKQVADGRIERTVPFVFSMSGETLDVGIDTCSPVGPTRSGSRSPAPSTGSRSTCGPALTQQDHDDLDDGQLRGAISQQ